MFLLHNTGRLVLHKNRLEYFDPVKDIKKGDIFFDKNSTTKLKDDFKFEILSQNKTYVFKLEKVEAKQCIKKINKVIKLL